MPPRGVPEIASETVRSDGGDTLPAEMPLFYVPSALRLILDRNLKVAGIPKCDDGGGANDRRSRTEAHFRDDAQSEWSRTPDCTSGDASLKDRSDDERLHRSEIARRVGAVESLPSMPLDGRLSDPSETVQSTGTDATEAQEFPPGTVQSGISESNSVTLGKIDEMTVEHVAKPQAAENPTKKGSFSMIENEPLSDPDGT